MIRNEEKKNQRIAMFTSLGIHGALFLLFFFIVAWKAPNPPLPEYGIELNFGLDTQGSGAVQPKTPVGSEGTQEAEPDQPEQVEALPETPVPVESKPIEQEVVSKVESPVKVEEKKEEVKPIEKPVEKVQPKKEEVVKPKEDPQAVYKPNTPKADSENKTDGAKAGTPGNQGDDKNSTGDKGSKEGSLDAKSMYGTQGGGGGPSLDLAGWVWDSKPNPTVPKNESGRIVFEIKVDDNGDIISIKTIERAASIEAEQACRKEVEKLSFTKTGANVPNISTGKITFVISLK